MYFSHDTYAYVGHEGRSPKTGPEAGREAPIVGIDAPGITAAISQQRFVAALRRSRGWRLEAGPNASGLFVPPAGGDQLVTPRSPLAKLGAIAIMSAKLPVNLQPTIPDQQTQV